MSDLGDVIWRLTVRDSQGKILFGPRTYLADKPMRAAVKRWEGKDAYVLREFAVRGAWQNMDAVPSVNHWSSWAVPSDSTWWTRMAAPSEILWDASTPNSEDAP